jgi:hypothetical protein
MDSILDLARIAAAQFFQTHAQKLRRVGFSL